MSIKKFIVSSLVGLMVATGTSNTAKDAEVTKEVIKLDEEISYGVVVKNFEDKSYIKLLNHGEGAVIEADYKHGNEADILVEVEFEGGEQPKATRIEGKEKELVLDKYEELIVEYREDEVETALITVENFNGDYVIGTDEIGYVYAVENKHNQYQVEQMIFAVLNSDGEIEFASPYEL